MIINGQPLPPELLALIDAGRWCVPKDTSGIDRLFPERGEFCLYSFAQMQSESEGFPIEESPIWLGAPDSSSPPGDIDPRRMVFVADLGIGWDQPVALDYRGGSPAPRVLTLRWSGRGETNRWVEIAPSFTEFARLIGLQ